MMSRIAGFINVELGACLSTTSDMLTKAEERLHRLGRSKQADEEDKAAYGNALTRIQRVRNGLHG